MSFWDSFTDVLAVVVTGPRQIIDTAIDVGDLVTGFQFTDKMHDAKQTLTDAGLKTPSDAIKDTFYSELPDLQAQVKAKHDEIVRLLPIAAEAEDTHNKAITKLGKMLDDVKLLATISSEAEVLFSKAAQLPHWQTWAKNSQVPVDTLNNLKISCEKWDAICKKILITQMSVNSADLAAMTTAAVISRIGKASAALKSANTLEKGLAATGDTAKAVESGAKVGGEALEVAGSVGKLARIGKVAADASAVLAVASMGLDIGLSVSQFENQKSTLHQNITALDKGISEANQDIHDMNAELGQVLNRIQELAGSVSAPEDDINWSHWFSAQQEQLRVALSKLTSFEGTREIAIKMAKVTGKDSNDDRMLKIQSVDSTITVDEAKEIIAVADKGQQQEAALVLQAYHNFQQAEGTGTGSRLIATGKAIANLAPLMLKYGEFPPTHPAHLGFQPWWKQVCLDQIDYKYHNGNFTDSLQELDRHVQSICGENMM